MSGAESPASFLYKIACLCELRDADGRYLLLHRGKAPNLGLYSPVGGKLETGLGESPAQCARREVHEETGVDLPIERFQLVGIISERGFGSGDGDGTNWLMFWYRVVGAVEVPWADEGRDLPEGRLEWVDPKGLFELELPETDRVAIWPTVLAHEVADAGGGLGAEAAGFFTLHIDCTGAEMRWSVEQSRMPGGAGVE